MWSRWFRMSALILCACALVPWMVGCSKKTTAPKPPAEQLNVDKPNGNPRITSQTRIGDADKRTTLWDLRSSDDASLGFRGIHNASTGVGMLNAGGSLRWFHLLTYVPTDISTLPGTAAVPHGLVVVGGHDSDGDGDSEVGYVSLYSSAGSLLSQVLVASDSSDVFLTSLVPVAESSFVACGGERRSGIVHPYVALFHLKAPGHLETGRTTVLQILTGSFSDVVTLPSSPTQVVLAATSRDGTSRSISGMRAPWPGFDPVAVEWSHEIVPTIGTWDALYELVEGGGNLYMAGTVNDDRKQPLPSNGGTWRSGLMASYTGSGGLRWLTITSVTGHTDEFRSVVVGSDAVYGVGIAANYFRGDPADEFGYGLISKLNLDTGQTVANFTLGEDRYQTGLNTATWAAGSLTCGGWTDFEISGGPYRGWVSTVNVSSTIVVPTATARTTATRLDGSPESRRGRDRDLN